ncbi:hypothetical protein NDU88_007763 [Pleurodeles waltl]|uniref:Uncharacterized protein n=1 Tax=Pleurodeles waltl TaxID=8319 RepID=A0AAV7N4D7_PLEWA|nr:hypothetical protein NDU88_007763 [Pleurodeles waltl]
MPVCQGRRFCCPGAPTRPSVSGQKIGTRGPERIGRGPDTVRRRRRDPEGCGGGNSGARDKNVGTQKAALVGSA